MPGFASNNPSDYIAVGRQTAKDTEATTFQYLKHLSGSSFDVEQSVERVREGGDGQETGLVYKTKVTADGDLNQNARGVVTSQILHGAMGVASQASIVASGALFENVFTPGATLPYYTVEQKYADTIERTTNAKITQLDISGEAGKPVTLKAKFVSGGSVHIATGPLTPTRDSTLPFMYPGASISVDGTSGYPVTKFKVTIKRSVDDDIQTYGLNREDVVENAFDVDLDFTRRYDNASGFVKINYGGGTQIALAPSTGSFSAVFVQGSQMFRLDLPCFVYAKTQVNKLDPEGKTMYEDVSAFSVKGGTVSIWAQVNSGATTGQF